MMELIASLLIINFLFVVPSLMAYHYCESDDTAADAFTKALFWPIFGTRGVYRSFKKTWSEQ